MDRSFIFVLIFSLVIIIIVASNQGARHPKHDHHNHHHDSQHEKIMKSIQSQRSKLAHPTNYSQSNHVRRSILPNQRRAFLRRANGIDRHRKKRQLDFRIDPDSGIFGHNYKTGYDNWHRCKRDRFCDPRSIEDWWMLYPYGKYVLDDELLGLVGRETQINLGQDCPYYGFRFNYTQVNPDGFISFGMPIIQQPPFDFPNPRWPMERDTSFIAPFYAETAFQYVGNTKISNVYFRTIHRPRIDNPAWDDSSYNNQPSLGYDQPNFETNGGYSGASNGGFAGANVGNFGGGFNNRKKRQIPGHNQVGIVIDVPLLNNITRDIQEGYNGANGFRAEHGLVVTWERMAFGGARKAVDISQFDQVLQWQNTFQLVLATDQIRTFAIINFARLNWTTSNAAGGLNGYGGFQPAMVGFNGGNGTGFVPLPRSGQGRIWKNAFYTNVMVPGRWIYRIDEQIIPGGCSNNSVGYVVTAPPFGVMVGGITVNISGPCLRPNDAVKVVFDEWPVDCKRLNRIRAQCIMPPFHKTGLMSIRMSRDGGQSYPFIGWFYVVPANRAPTQVLLLDSVENPMNRWHVPNPDTLTVQWQALNLTYDYSARVDINLFGYYEDAFRSHFKKIDSITTQLSNSGKYSFSPNTMVRNPINNNDWKKFSFGMVQVAISNDENHGVLWSKITPFGFYNLPYYQKHHGNNWATDLCIDWYEYDGRRQNFYMYLPACPCRMEQALLDLGRYMPIFDCDKDANGACTFHKGALHCVQSLQATFNGAGQQCCYDYQGYLMFSDDWEPTSDLARFYQPGVPSRGSMFGSPPFTRQPPRIPSFSHWQNDLMPYYQCCHYADHCEFYYWRRKTHTCQGYLPPGAAYMFGEPHVHTFDGVEYNFPGKGYYVLAMSEDPFHRLMVQVRLEQPDPTLWRTNVNATVITGVAIRENNSDTIQVFARKPLRRWRYRMDVLVNGINRWFDKPHWKYQQFDGVSLRNPQLNMNQSEVIVILASGASVRVRESYGMLDVMVALPPSFNSSCDQTYMYNGPGSVNNLPYGVRPCYITRGLAGAWNGDKTDDLMTLDGAIVGVPKDTYTEATTRDIYERFAKTYEVDPTNPRIGPVLFQDTRKPIYNPLLFADKDYRPRFYVDRVPRNAAMILNIDVIKATCQGQVQCEYDFLMTGRREVAATTLSYRNRFLTDRREGTKQLISCGPLYKLPGIMKAPPSKNYLEGDSVVFTCRAKYFIHGTQQRHCVNGTWSPGWWAWCRERDLEWALKWLTGILVALSILLIIIGIFCGLWKARQKKEADRKKVYRAAGDIAYNPGKAAEKSNVSSFDHEPGRVGLANGSNGVHKPMPIFAETTA